MRNGWEMVWHGNVLVYIVSMGTLILTSTSYIWVRSYPTINPTNNHPYQALKSKNLTSMNHKNNEKWNMIAKTVRDFPERSSEIQLLYNYLDPDLVPSPPILLYGPSGTKAFPHFSCHIQIWIQFNEIIIPCDLLKRKHTQGVESPAWP